MNVLAPELHPGQETVRRSRARWRVLACGRRWGKSLLALLLALESALRGGRVLWIAPTFQVSELAWSNAKRLLGPIASRLTFRESTRTLHVNGVDGCIVFRSAEQGDALRGDAFGGEPGDLGVVVDEAAFVDVEVWSTIVRPMLADRRASALLVSTPDGMNWFHDLFKHARADTTGEWEAFQFSTSNNPHIAPEEVEAMRQGMPALAVLQEIEAQFVSQAGARVQRSWLRIEVPPHCTQIVQGIDLAISERSSADWSAIVTMGRGADGKLWVLDVERTRSSFHELMAFIQRSAAKWKPSVIAIEQVGAHVSAGILTELQRLTQLPVRGVRAVGSKLERFAPLEGRIQSGMLRFARDLPPFYIDELLSFGADAPHDDCVDATVHAFSVCDAPRTFPEFDPAKHTVIESDIECRWTIRRKVIGVSSNAFVVVGTSRDGTRIVLDERVFDDPIFSMEPGGAIDIARHLANKHRVNEFACDERDTTPLRALRSAFGNTATVTRQYRIDPDDTARLVRLALVGTKGKPRLYISKRCQALTEQLTAYGPDRGAMCAALTNALMDTK